MAEPRKVSGGQGGYRPKSYAEMESQAGRIHGAIVPRMRQLTDETEAAEKRRKMEWAAGEGREFIWDTSDRDRARALVRSNTEYQRLQRRLNRVDAFIDRNRPNFEEEPIDIFNPDANSPERRRNLARLNRRTRTRR